MNLSAKLHGWYVLLGVEIVTFDLLLVEVAREEYPLENLPLDFPLLFHRVVQIGSVLHKL